MPHWKATLGDFLAAPPPQVTPASQDRASCPIAGIARPSNLMFGYSGKPTPLANVLPMESDPYTACGIVGAACYITAYFATLQGWLRPSGWHFPAINLLGAGLVLISLSDTWNLPSVILESFWAVISVYGLVRSRRG